MNAKSIDGLRRRDRESSLNTSKKPIKKTSIVVGMKPTVSVVSPRQRITVEETKTKAPEKKASGQDAAVRDFLSSVKDSDPTNLVAGTSEKKLGRKERRRQKKEEKRVEKPRGKRRVVRIILRALAVLLVIAIAALAWLYIQGNDLVSRVTGGGNLIDAIFADPDIPLKTDPVTGRTNVLVFGTEGYSMDDPNWDGGHLTDSMMVASIDQDSGDVRTISIPRDLKAKTCTSTAKLNEVYYCNYKEKGTAEGERVAAMALAAQIGEILGIEIQYFAHANWQAVVQIVDSLGGIDVAFVYGGTTWAGKEVALETTSKNGLRDYYNPKTGKWGIDFRNDQVYHLNGEQALGVARSRNSGGGYGSGSNFSREQFQQKIIQAVIAKAKKANFATDWIATMGVKDAVGDNLRISFDAKELKTLFNLVSRVDLTTMQSVSIEEDESGKRLLTTGSLQSTNGQYYSYVYPAAGVGNYLALHEYVKRRLSPPSVETEAAEVIVMNATAIGGMAASESAWLERAGFLMETPINAPAGFEAEDGVVVYQLNKGMPKTAEALRNQYAEVGRLETNVPKALDGQNADFVVVLGGSYEGY